MNKTLIDNYIRDITKVTPISKSEARARLDEIIKQALKNQNTGALRQWLNEKPNDRLVTDEDILTFLNL